MRNWTYSAIAVAAGIAFGLAVVSPWMRPRPLGEAFTKPASIPRERAHDNMPPIVRLIADEPDVDLGVLPEGEIVEHTFVLRNVSSAPLSIAGVRGSCGCTTADVDLETLAPGQLTKLHATVDMADYVGEFDRTIIVEIDDRNAASLTLTLFGSVQPDND